MCWRQNTAGIFDQQTGRYRAAAKKGVSDILGVLPGGRFLAVEVKTRTGAIRPEQTAFLDEVRANGGLAMVVRSLEDLKTGLGLA
jgi:hypothetical protein